MNEELFECLLRYVGQTVTVFTESGGLSGSGFTGTLAGIFNGAVRLITQIGAAPACPIGSSCIGYDQPSNNSCGWGCGCGCGCGCGGGNGYATGYGNGISNYNLGWNWGYPNQVNNIAYPAGYNWLGSVCEIPLCKIVSFTHVAI